jgi:hypothetical protein
MPFGNAIAASKDAGWHFFNGSGQGQSPMARSDKTLLAVFLLATVLGTWTRCLLMNDGAVFMSAGWLGDAWHLYFDQIAGRAVSVLTLFGPTASQKLVVPGSGWLVSL